MKKDKAMTEIGQQYATAHDAHYKTKNLRQALGLYQSLVAAHPDTHEAEYSRAQIHNIAKNTVPKQELLDAQINMAVDHLEGEEASVVGPAPAGTTL